MVRLCLQSCLTQTYENLKIRISDNTLADGNDEIKRLVDEFDSPKLIYEPTSSNIGGVANYSLLLNKIDSQFVLMVSSDWVLTPHAVETLVGGQKWSKLAVVKGAGEAWDGASEGCPRYRDERSVVECSDIVYSEFANYANIISCSGTIFGCLVSVDFLRGIRFTIPDKYSHHGIDEYGGFTLLLRSKKYAQTTSLIYRGIINDERYDDCIRPDRGYLWYEVTKSRFDWLNDNQPRLLRGGYNLRRLYWSLFRRTIKYFHRSDELWLIVLLLSMASLCRAIFWSMVGTMRPAPNQRF